MIFCATFSIKEFFKITVEQHIKISKGWWSNWMLKDEHKDWKVKTVASPRGRGVLTYITYTGMCRPTGSWFWSSWFRTGYPFQRRCLERGIIFRTHESSSFVSSHLKLFNDRLLLKIWFNALTSKLLYSCCTLCFSVQDGRIFYF